MKIIAREALYVKDIKPGVRARLTEDYTFRFYNEQACAKCEYRSERHSDICDNCNAFLGAVQLASPVKINGDTYMKLPIGDLPKVQKKLKKYTGHSKFTIVDKQVNVSDHPFKRPIRFKYKKLKDFQRPAVKSIINNKLGVLKSAPRTGKTVMSAAAICKLGAKTLIMAGQRTWLEGFYETFCGSKTQKRFTDATGAGVTSEDISAWRKAGRPHRSIGFAKTIEDFKRLDICLCTYQTFLSKKGRNLLKEIRSMFAVLVVDEVHTANADRFSYTVAQLRSEYKIGLSGTPQRKDRKEIIVQHLFGPIIHETHVEQLRPRVSIVNTKYAYDKKYARWDQMVSSLENNPKRLRLIAEQAVKDAKRGHMILIPLWRVKSLKALSMAINKIAGKRISDFFYGGVSKDKRINIIQQARDYKLKVVVGNMKMLSTGINIPRASLLYEVTLSSNAPNAEQRFKRVLTPYKDKPMPEIKYFLDNMGVRKACMRSEYWNCLLPKVNPIVDPKTKLLLTQYFNRNNAQSKIEI